MKTALIVDDSRVARAVLRKTLVGFGIEVDEVPTAEAAIEYLKVDSPDVIFLDHMMPGMDGFDALGALKANPRTATIPVLMYTAQEGQFYVSQARALGAVDVMPKSLAPADVERILRRHHLIGEPNRAEEPRPIGESRRLDETGSYPREVNPLDLDRRDLIRRLQTMLDERSVSLMAEFRRELGRVQLSSEMALREMLDEFRPKPARSSIRLAAGAGIGACALLIAAGIPFVARHSVSDDGLERMATSTMTDPAASARSAEAIPVTLASADSEKAALAANPATSWDATQSYAFGSMPLDDARARQYALLFTELGNRGFEGTVTIDVYEGRHCIDYAADGSARLAPPDQPASSCDYIGTPGSGTAAALQSPMFATMVAAATRDGRISVDTVLHGTSEPLIDYPSLDYAVTAEEWNSIADLNQRISVRVRGLELGPSEPLAARLTY